MSQFHKREKARLQGTELSCKINQLLGSTSTLKYTILMDCISRPLSPAIAFPTTLFKPPRITAARMVFLSRPTSLKLAISPTPINPNSFNGGGGVGGGGDDSHSNSNSDNDGDNNSKNHLSLFLICSSIQLAASACAVASNDDENDEFMLYQVKGGNKIKLIPDFFKDVFVIPHTKFSTSFSSANFWLQFRTLFMRLMLPEGFPISVTSDYLEYSLWRSVQGVAAQVSGVLATQVFIIIITPQTYIFNILALLFILNAFAIK